MEQKRGDTPREGLIRFLKFFAFSLGAGVIQILSFALLNELLKLEYWLSYFIALVLSVLYNFTVNRRFTFKSAKNVPIAMLLVGLFYLFFTPYSMWLEDYMTKLGYNEYLVLLINMVQNFVLEYLWCRYVIYRNNVDTNELAKKAAAEPAADEIMKNDE